MQIGDRDHKTLCNSGAGCCILSWTVLFESPNKIRAINGSEIDNQDECDITFGIGWVEFTFPFLVSNALTQRIILGYNFSKAFHIGTTWNTRDQMCLPVKGHIIATTVSTTAISA